MYRGRLVSAGVGRLVYDDWLFGNRGAYVSENHIIQSNWSESIDFKIGESFLVLDLTFLFIALTNF